MEILPGIYRVEQLLGARYLYQYVVAGDRPLLIDTGIASSPEEVILPALAGLGIAPGRLGTVLITHADVDHMGGNAAIKRAAPRARLVAHAADQPWIESRERILRERYGWYAAHGLDYEPAVQAWLRDNLGPDEPLDATVDAGEWLDLGGQRLQVLRLPGHTPGHTGLWEPETRTALISDAVLERGVYDTAGRLLQPPPYFTVQPYLATIAQLERLAPDHLLTAHYPAMHGTEVSRFLTESRRFVGDLDQSVAGILREAGRPLTLRAITEQADARVGPFPSFANELAGPVRAHLEELVSGGRARHATVDGRACWEWSGP